VTVGDLHTFDDVIATDRVRTWSWRVLALATSLVIALSAVRGIRRSYEVIGDNALIELRGRDVLTSHHPWLGTWSSASISSGIDINHPGPLLFEMVALPVRLFGGPAGIALAIAALQICVVWLVGWVAARTAGATAAVVAQLITALLVWTLGSELLYDPWQPNVLVLPFWLFVVSVWAVTADEVALLPLAVGVGSFAMQTHLGYLFIVPILVAFALTTALVRRRGRGPGRFGDLRRPVTLSVVVLGVLWAQPLWEQLFGPGRGNISRIVVAGTVGGNDFEPVESTPTGISVGLRVLGSVLALPPWWGRPGFDSAIPPSTWIDDGSQRVLDAPGLRTLGPSVLGLVILVVVIALAWRWVRRLGNRQLEAGFQTLAVAGAVATVTTIVTPIDILGLSPHKVRWLWVIGAFATYLLVMAVIAGLGDALRHRVLVGLAALSLVVVVATVPTYVNRSGPVYFRETYASITDLREQLDDFLEQDGTLSAVEFDAEGIGFAEPYTAPVMAELLRNGVDVEVADRTLARQLGPDRLLGDERVGTATLPLVFVRAGEAATVVPPGAERIAFHDGDRSAFTLDDVTDRAVGVFLVRSPAAVESEAP
jgi:CDP-diglyceride synthetase